MLLGQSQGAWIISSVLLHRKYAQLVERVGLIAHPGLAPAHGHATSAPSAWPLTSSSSTRHRSMQEGPKRASRSGRLRRPDVRRGPRREIREALAADDGRPFVA
jgi:hypothetical protein